MALVKGDFKKAWAESKHALEDGSATSQGLAALVGGEDVVRQRITERNAAPAPPTAQRMQTLESLRSSGAISEDEYTAKRELIIDEI